MTPQTIRDLSRKTGFGVVDCNKALKMCNNNEGVAVEYLRLKSQPVVRQKLVKGRWVNWSDSDYVKEAKRQYFEGSGRG